jgi:hypothetical protein
LGITGTITTCLDAAKKIIHGSLLSKVTTSSLCVGALAAHG